MKMVSAHSHLLTQPDDMDHFAETGLFSQVWLLGLPEDMKISNYFRPCGRRSYPSTDAELVELSKRFPGFYVPFKWVDYTQGPDQIDRAVDQGFAGFKGICPKRPYDDDLYIPIYERINKYKSAMIFHTGHVSTPAYENRCEKFGYDARFMTPSNLYKIAKFFPDMTVIAAHCGVPWQSELLSLCVRHCPNFYMDMSGGDTETLIDFVETYGMGEATGRDEKPCVIADKILAGIDAYLGESDLHRDIRGGKARMEQWREKCIAEKHPIAEKLPGIFYKNAEFLLNFNQLYHS